MKVVLIHFLMFALFNLCYGQITGNILDMFGNPVDGATIQIDNTSISSKSNSEGEYSIDYVPGKVKVIFSKPGYSTDTLMVDIYTQTKFPAKSIRLYEIPSERGLWALGENSYIKLSDGKIHFSEKDFSWNHPEGKTKERKFYATGGFSSVGKNKKIKIIDNDGVNNSLLEVNSDNTVMTGTLYAMSWVVSPKYFIKETLKEILPGVWLREVELKEGRYVYVTKKDAKNFLSGPAFKQPTYLFEVGSPSASSGSSNTNTVSSSPKAEFKSKPIVSLQANGLKTTVLTLKANSIEKEYYNEINEGFINLIKSTNRFSESNDVKDEADFIIDGSIDDFKIEYKTSASKDGKVRSGYLAELNFSVNLKDASGNIVKSKNEVLKGGGVYFTESMGTKEKAFEKILNSMKDPVWSIIFNEFPIETNIKEISKTNRKGYARFVTINAGSNKGVHNGFDFNVFTDENLLIGKLRVRSVENNYSSTCKVTEGEDKLTPILNSNKTLKCISVY